MIIIEFNCLNDCMLKGSFFAAWFGYKRMYMCVVLISFKELLEFLGSTTKRRRENILKISNWICRRQQWKLFSILARCAMLAIRYAYTWRSRTFLRQRGRYGLHYCESAKAAFDFCIEENIYILGQWRNPFFGIYQI